MCLRASRAGITLLSAWGKLTRHDEVTLLTGRLRTHTTQCQLLTDARQGNAHYSNVVVIEDDLTDGQLKALMEMSHALAAPSRGEGFGSPLLKPCWWCAGDPNSYGGHIVFVTMKMPGWWTTVRASANALWVSGFNMGRALCRGSGTELRALYDAPRSEHQPRAGRGRERLLADLLGTGCRAGDGGHRFLEVSQYRDSQ